MAALLDLPLEMLTCVCRHLDLRDLARVAGTCKRLRHGDSGLETVELPTKSPVVTSLGALAFPVGEPIPNTRPIGCSDSWVAYLARCARQRRCREAPPIAAGGTMGVCHSLYLCTAGQVLACGEGAATGHGDENWGFSAPTPVATLASVRVRSFAAGRDHSLALGWDDRIYSWGSNQYGQLGHENFLRRSSPVLVEKLEGVCGVAATNCHSLAETHSGAVFSWGRALLADSEDVLRPIIVEGFGGVRVRRVCAGVDTVFAIGETGEVFFVGEMCLRASRPRRSARPALAEARRGAAGRSGEQCLSWGLACARAGGGWTDVRVGWGHSR
jgi:hypothetical protein